jgi:sirohydrochlorin cobaltochelatase
MADLQNGIILFAHGSRDPLWRAPVDAVAARIRGVQPGVPVRCAYLELCAPDLPTAAIELVASGCLNISVMPLFLGVGKHAREDLPLLMAELRQAHPQVVFAQQAAVGEDPRLIALIAEIALEARPNLSAKTSPAA